MNRRFGSLQVLNEPATAAGHIGRRDWAAPAVVVGHALETSGRSFPSLAGRSGSACDNEDFTRPLLLGYVRRDLLVTDDQVDQLEREMAKFAQAEGFSMGFTYIEKAGTWPAAFDALMQSVNRYEITAVVLPSLLHFAVLDAPHDIKDMFERATGARVVVLDPC
jgi:hypothetical protein